MQPHSSVSHAEVNRHKENLRQAKADGHTLLHIFFVPIHTRQYSITLCYDATLIPCTQAFLPHFVRSQGRQTLAVISIGRLRS